MGAPNFTCAEASWSQALADWIGAHTRAFEAIDGVPNLLVPDNTRVAVIKACLYEPQVNRTYAEMAAHYDTAVLPARPRATKRKSRRRRGVSAEAVSTAQVGFGTYRNFDTPTTLGACPTGALPLARRPAVISRNPSRALGFPF
jgi:transposase